MIHGLRKVNWVNVIYRQCVTLYITKNSSNPNARRYAEEPDWQGLVHVFTKSLSDSPFNEMILLLRSKAPRFQRWAPQYVWTVKCENLKEIPDCLHVKSTCHPDTRALANSPPSLLTPEGHLTEPRNDDGQQKHPDSPKEGILNSSGSEAPVDNGGHEEVSTSPEEI